LKVKGYCSRVVSDFSTSEPSTRASIWFNSVSILSSLPRLKVHKKPDAEDISQMSEIRSQIFFLFLTSHFLLPNREPE